MAFARSTDLFIAGHFGQRDLPFFLPGQDVRDDDWRISRGGRHQLRHRWPRGFYCGAQHDCRPMYGYDPIGECRVPFGTAGSMGVMAVDNLPCELPRDASADFGATLLEQVIPLVAEGDAQGILERASETNLKGELKPRLPTCQSTRDLLGNKPVREGSFLPFGGIGLRLKPAPQRAAQGFLRQACGHGFRSRPCSRKTGGSSTSPPGATSMLIHHNAATAATVSRHINAQCLSPSKVVFGGHLAIVPGIPIFVAVVDGT